LMIGLVYHTRNFTQVQTVERVWFFTVAILVVKDALTAFFFTEAPPLDGESRLGMGVTHATELSLFSVLIFWMSFGFKGGTYRIFLWPFRIFLICVMIAAKSRTPIVGFAMGGLCYFFLNTRDALKRGLVISCATCLMVFLLFAMTLGQSWAKGMSSYMKRGQDIKELASFTGRTFIWQHVLKESKKSPIVGRGYGVSRLTMGDVREADWEWEPPHCHNEMLEVFFNTGLLGLIPFIVMILYNTKWIFNSVRLQEIFSRPIALHAMFLVMILLVSMMLEVRLSGRLSPVQPLYFFYLMLLDRRDYFRRLRSRTSEEVTVHVGNHVNKGKVLPARTTFVHTCG
ncbi:MAG: O-antigen ligase family protein, partial [Sedimentisphaerales bacterium]|nr:O-antigen ligase family protein [Sedimentisphaerales bacterium]